MIQWKYGYNKWNQIIELFNHQEICISKICLTISKYTDQFHPFFQKSQYCWPKVFLLTKLSSLLKQAIQQILYILYIFYINIIRISFFLTNRLVLFSQGCWNYPWFITVSSFISPIISHTNLNPIVIKPLLNSIFYPACQPQIIKN